MRTTSDAASPAKPAHTAGLVRFENATGGNKMTIKATLSLAAVSALMLAPAALGQQEEHRIGGKAVPQEQVAEVQAQCDAMRKGERQSPVAEAAASESNDQAAADAAAETAVDLSSDLWIDGGERISVEKLSVELCDEGNFSLTPEQ